MCNDHRASMARMNGRLIAPLLLLAVMATSATPRAQTPPNLNVLWQYDTAG